MKSLILAASMAIVCAAATAPSANAQPAEDGYQVRDLYEACDAVDRYNSARNPSTEDGIIAVECMSYIRGWLDSMYLLRQDCMTGDQPTPDEGRRIFMNWAYSNQQYQTTHRGVGMGVALSLAYGCQP
jgi:hypothetical protein